ncbi:hypothetical protein [Stutzerimonas balearica]|uniref:hypothetical protein n=1 Tax=Stutzerimonas balearica TaxID=74829 RepID=UPI00190AFE34|nr:hypothetical protein [Stutzerimonas balearica]MBK3749074.1 hypothetical protein [Stutzerimonas balearica]MBK3827271.1 hypothetical protein [Stutzerimonas balearica]MBK3856961.1 hypothetical protein [Stutzerimonas balearica]MBS4148719.1 hypothetical protein [Stutzerimonas balearica]
MYLIQILLPLYRNDGQALPRALFRQVRDELIERFGGLTAYTRAPASGYWQEDPLAPPNHDDSVIYEVMAARLERDWWQRYRGELERRFEQESLLLRAQRVERL